jgi:hypothetical protein
MKFYWLLSTDNTLAELSFLLIFTQTQEIHANGTLNKWIFAHLKAYCQNNGIKVSSSAKQRNKVPSSFAGSGGTRLDGSEGFFVSAYFADKREKE